MTTAPATAEPQGLDALVARFADPRVRGLLFAGLGGLAMVFLVLFERGADIGGIAIGMFGVVGLVFGWRASPVFVLLVLLYFLVFPFGVPPPEEDPFELAEGHFRLADLLLAAALVVYLSAHYRLHGVTVRAMPDEDGGKKAAARKRPPELIRPGELWRLGYLVAGVVLAGQVVWAVVANVEIDTLAPFPFRFPDDPALFRRDTGDLAAWRTRLVATAGLLFFGTLFARLVFGYWRLRTMTPAEGTMLLLDAGWDETRRERVRVEGWRMWGVKRVADRVRAGKVPPKGKPK